MEFIHNKKKKQSYLMIHRNKYTFESPFTIVLLTSPMNQTRSRWKVSSKSILNYFLQCVRNNNIFNVQIKKFIINNDTQTVQAVNEFNIFD